MCMKQETAKTVAFALPTVLGRGSFQAQPQVATVSRTHARYVNRVRRTHRVVATTTSSDAQQVIRSGEPHNVSVILLAGGVGKRMGGAIPKQMLPLGGMTILERSLIALSQMREVSEIIVVLCPTLRDTAAGRACAAVGAIFADPGEERVDSVASGVAASRGDTTLFCVHDAARPLVQPDDVRRVIEDAWRHGAAVLGVPCKATIKTSDNGQFVRETLDRAKLWEMQTPQVIDADTLRAGLKKAAMSDNAPVTDDVSLVELLGLPVFLTNGRYDNIKITTPEDMLFADAVLQAQAQEKQASSVAA